MNSTLQDLPAELLLHIIENLTTPTFSGEPLTACVKKGNQMKLFMKLRATCVSINAKIVYFLASRYLKDITIQCSHDSLSRLQQLSESWLRVHVQRITITILDMFSPDVVLYESLMDMPDYGYDGLECDEFTLNESFMDSIVDGSCGRILAESSVKFRHLEALCITPPAATEEMWFEIGPIMLKEIRSRWALTVKVLLNAVSTGSYNLEAFIIDHPDGSIGFPLSALDMAVVHRSDWLSSLKKVKLDMFNDLDEAALPTSTRIFNLIVKRLPSLTELKLSLSNSPASYFEQIAVALPTIALQRLTLSHIRIRSGELRTFVNAVKNSLRSFKLSCTHFNESEDFQSLLFQLMDLKLERCDLILLNAGECRVDFKPVNEMRPHIYERTKPSECTHANHDACEWTIIGTEICSHNMFLTNDDGGNVTLWLRVAAKRVVLGRERWDFDFLTC